MTNIVEVCGFGSETLGQGRKCAPLLHSEGAGVASGSAGEFVIPHGDDRTFGPSRLKSFCPSLEINRRLEWCSVDSRERPCVSGRAAKQSGAASRRVVSSYGDHPLKPDNLSVGETITRCFEDFKKSQTLDKNPWSVLPSSEGDCLMSSRLVGKAGRIVRELALQGLKREFELPSYIRCGDLRAAVRSCFGEVTVLDELSLKTVQKIEKKCCTVCAPRFDEMKDEWYESRFKPVEVDEHHLELFRDAVRNIVPRGWDTRRDPFIPNGHATLNNSRKKGGNWNKEEFSDRCAPSVVFSAGKPRIVTSYSSYNTSTLAELHYSLYNVLQRQGWLLVGDPLDRHVEGLMGGDYVSVDYTSATDNIKNAYVSVLIDVLEERAESMSPEEKKCLRVLGSLRFVGDEREATRGQPMGSVMSFPMLCIVNKAVFDLSMNDLIRGKKITFPEWTRHKCLINGDDLLTREPRKDSDIRGLIAYNGGKIGLVLNQSKTLKSEDIAEINSTFFRNARLERKFNAASLYMGAHTADVLGFARASTRDNASFRRVVRANVHALARQADKHLDTLPGSLKGVCRRDRKIRSAIVSLPTKARVTEKGIIMMVPEPENYRLSRDDRLRAMREEVECVRERWIPRGNSRMNTTIVPNAVSFNSVLRKRRECGKRMIPACYLRAFKRNWSSSEMREVASPYYATEPAWHASHAQFLIDFIRLHAVNVPSRKEPEQLGDFPSLA
jgi:hypothetical protein